MRKNTNLRPWNRIGIYWESDSEAFKNMIANNLNNINEELMYSVQRFKSAYGEEEPLIVEQTINLVGHNVHITITDIDN